ncbi:hypothetical protein LY90DRAFT_374706 [Neocallimastix californiae]|uniref:Uncharacterized protein n=1 Tax=Neocallimastix californiae TaxID=1754190 RepID=A0A1Y2FR62_9FUNG|nr:hypothetical protein LY90DRAFT_374706 [Neocallimastix californiae]|eukprot:ORY85804.1 hypothetical protein LY90DRAFT_374706 [Neocallimastix californiae]
MQVKTDIKYKFIILISILLFFYITLFNYSNFIEIHGNNVISTTSENTIIRKSEFNRSILYVSRHDGTISNFVNIAQRLSFNVTLMRPPYGFEKRPYCFEKDKCQSFVELICSQYDYIVISDIIPDSYIYFTNPCSAKVVLEITNRFDIFVKEENKVDYYEKLGKAVVENKDLTVVENNPYEVFHACIKGVFIPNYYLIRPLGFAPPEVMGKTYDETHEEIAVIEHTEQDKKLAIPKLKELNISLAQLPHRYGGPLVLATYKAVLMLPYQVSIMKMMENFRYGVAMIVPSEKLFRELIKEGSYYFAEKHLQDIPDGLTNYVEWYNKEFEGLFVYFDSWEELPEIIKNTDFDALKLKVKQYIDQYQKKALNLWAQVLDVIPRKNMIKNKDPLCDNKDFYYKSN